MGVDNLLIYLFIVAIDEHHTLIPLNLQVSVYCQIKRYRVIC